MALFRLPIKDKSEESVICWGKLWAVPSGMQWYSGLISQTWTDNKCCLLYPVPYEAASYIVQKMS